MLEGDDLRKRITDLKEQDDNCEVRITDAASDEELQSAWPAARWSGSARALRELWSNDIKEAMRLQVAQ